MAGKKENKTIYITHGGELLFWLVIVFIIVLIYTCFYNVKEKSNNDFTLFMSDADGLIVGSPVRMMGIPVGYIKKIKPVHDEVFIKFVLYDDSITIPQGTVATVEFNGMAGSKSLELYLPDKNTYVDQSTPILTATSPKRLHDALGLLNDMFDKLGSIINTSSSFGEKIKSIDLPNTKGGDIKSFLQYSDNLLDEYNSKTIKFSKNIKHGTN